MAAPTTTIDTMRRSTRIRAQMPVRVRSLDPSVPFDLLTSTIIVNAQGCGVQSDAELPLNLPVELSLDDRTTTGRTLNSAVIDASRSIYITGIALDHPGNFWGMASPPADWGEFTPVSTPKKVHPFAKRRAEPAGAVPAATAAAAAAIANGVTAEEIRQRFDSVVAEYTARARAESAAEWQKWKDEAVAALNEIRHNLGAELSVDAEKWKRETQRAEQSLAALIKAGQEHARAVEEQAAKSMADLQKLTEAAPQLLADRAVEAVETITSDTQRRVAAAVTAEIERLQSRIREMSAATGEQARAGVLSDLETPDFAKRVEFVLGHLEAKESAMRASADEISARLARQSEEAMAGLRHQVEDALARHEAEVAARLAGRNDELAKRAEEESAARMQALQTAAEKALQDIEARGQVLTTSREQLERAAEAALEKIDARLASAQQEIQQATSASLEQIKSGQQQIEERVQQQSWEYEAQAEAATTKLQEKLTSALQRIDSHIEEKRSRIAAEATKAAQEAKAQLEKTRGYLESLITALPENVRAKAEQQAADAWKAIREKSEKELAGTLKAERERAAAALRDEIAASAKRMREEMAAHAQHTATELQTKLAEEITRRREQIVAELQTKATQMTDAAAATFAQKTDRMLGESKAALHKSAGEVIGGELQRAQRELQERAGKQSEAALAKLRQQSEGVIAGQVASIGSLTSQASELVSQLAESAARADAKTEALEKQLDDAQKWLASHTAEFEKTVHDAFLTARGEIKGRVASAADTAEELIRQKSREALAGVEAAAMAHAEVVARQTDEAEAKIRALQATAAESAENLLKERLAETLEVFRADAARLAESTIQRWQSAMEDTLRSVPEMMKSRMTGASSGGD